ncbi:hypothetical protein JB92DRAFT_1799491 [Gautieria morchelliformis]|nr:hypothetical protein JB92DRAFT_1799491 [Gautieria morchelliformis]
MEYGIFGSEFQLELSTRPEKYLGEIETWDVAEKQLSEALEKFHPEMGAQQRRRRLLRARDRYLNSGCSSTFIPMRNDSVGLPAPCESQS